MEPSVGSKGDSYDSALAEAINGMYKAELIYRQSWKSRCTNGDLEMGALVQPPAIAELNRLYPACGG